jgi:hypothetical protein
MPAPVVLFRGRRPAQWPQAQAPPPQQPPPADGIGIISPDAPLVTEANMESVRWAPACPLGHVAAASLALIARISSNFAAHLRQ